MLIGVGIATIYSVGHPAEHSPDSQGEDLSNKWERQVVFAIVGLASFIVINSINYRRLGSISYWIFAGILVLLVILLISKYVVVLPFAKPKNGTYRWIWFSIGGYPLPQLQPSEFCKLAYILALAWYLRYRSNYRNFKALIGPFALALLPMVLIHCRGQGQAFADYYIYGRYGQPVLMVQNGGLSADQNKQCIFAKRLDT